jgi:hypothetical protein
MGHLIRNGIPNLGTRASVERSASSGHFIQDDAKGKQIGTRIEVLTPKLFW